MPLIGILIHVAGALAITWGAYFAGRSVAGLIHPWLVMLGGGEGWVLGLITVVGVWIGIFWAMHVEDRLSGQGRSR